MDFKNQMMNLSINLAIYLANAISQESSYSHSVLTMSFMGIGRADLRMLFVERKRYHKTLRHCGRRLSVEDASFSRSWDVIG